MTGKVYFFHNGKECKIGYTTPDLLKRLWQAHVWSPYALNIVGWINTEFPEQLEKAIHLELASKRLVKPSGNGEWFDLTIAETKEVIERNKHGHIKHYTYSHAPGHPAHFVRPLRRGQQDETAGHGKTLPERIRRLWHPDPKPVFHVGSTEYGLGGKAFLRKAGT